VDAWIGVVGAAVGALAALGGQWISAKTTERVAHRGRQHGVLDDLSRKLATIREQALDLHQRGGGDDADLVAALRAVQTITPSIHDDELRKRVTDFIDTTYGFRVKPTDWTIMNAPYIFVRQRLAEVYKKLG
jgi:hypothetical protein